MNWAFELLTYVFLTNMLMLAMYIIMLYDEHRRFNTLPSKKEIFADVMFYTFLGIIILILLLVEFVRDMVGY